MSEYSELEYKYKADNIKLKDFIALMETLDVVKSKSVSSWDHYYTSGVEDEFLRYRESTEPELTIKRKTNKSNNWERIEIDLPLDQKRIKLQTVSKFVDLLGYTEKKSIYKTCLIYWLDSINFVYYIVYNDDMKEIGRFIEVEVNKGYVDPNGTRNDHLLANGEWRLANIGIMPQNRLKKSLYEMFIK